MPDIVLHQFRASHFNDKVRWALAWKGLKHKRISYLPGLHARPMQEMSGQRQTPVLVIDGKAIAGTSAIIAALEALKPAPPLYPADAALRAQALAIEKRFDDDIGPATRSIVFGVLVDELDYMVRLFGHGEKWLKRFIYRRAVPRAVPMVRRLNGVNSANIARSEKLVAEALDWIAAETKAKPYLVGDAFSVADLAAAALMSPLCVLDHPDMCPRPPVPKAMADLHARYADHPGMKWVQARYRDNRPADPQQAHASGDGPT